MLYIYIGRSTSTSSVFCGNYKNYKVFRFLSGRVGWLHDGLMLVAGDGSFRWQPTHAWCGHFDGSVLAVEILTAV